MLPNQRNKNDAEAAQTVVLYLDITPSELQLDKILHSTIILKTNQTFLFGSKHTSLLLRLIYLSFEGDTWLVPFMSFLKCHGSDDPGDSGSPVSCQSDPCFQRQTDTDHSPSSA